MISVISRVLGGVVSARVEALFDRAFNFELERDRVTTGEGGNEAMEAAFWVAFATLEDMI